LAERWQCAIAVILRRLARKARARLAAGGSLKTKLAASLIEKGEGPPSKKEAALGGAALTRIRFSSRIILAPRRRASLKAPDAFAGALSQAFEKCLAGSSGGVALPRHLLPRVARHDRCQAPLLLESAIERMEKEKRRAAVR
jgi:hypothetical protein